MNEKNKNLKKYEEFLNEIFEKIEKLKNKIEKEQELFCNANEKIDDIYETLINCGIEIADTISIITNEPFDSVIERLSEN